MHQSVHWIRGLCALTWGSVKYCQSRAVLNGDPASAGMVTSMFPTWCEPASRTRTRFDASARRDATASPAATVQLSAPGLSDERGALTVTAAHNHIVKGHLERLSEQRAVGERVERDREVDVQVEGRKSR